MQRKTLIFFLVVLLLLAGSYWGFRKFLPSGSDLFVIIRQDGNIIYDAPLDKDAAVPVHSQWGYNLVIIKDGAVRVQESDCRDQICVHEGTMDKHNITTRSMGNTIVCLPHRLSITLVEKK